MRKTLKHRLLERSVASIERKLLILELAMRDGKVGAESAPDFIKEIRQEISFSLNR